MSHSDSVEASYFDGRSAKAQVARLDVVNGQWQMELQGQAPVSFVAASVKVEEANKHLPRRLSLPDGGILEIADQRGFEHLLVQIGYSRTTLDRAQNSWKAALSALLAVVLLAIGTVLWGIPAVAGVVAKSLPLSADKYVGDQAWESIEKEMFLPSKLHIERQAQLRERFVQMTSTDPNAPKVELLFRASKIGPNAIAIPGGRIVMTDELVAVAKEDEAILGVLAHEVGHQYHRHSMRQIVQVSAVAGLVSLWFGDLNALVAAAPTLLIANKYSREFEFEADGYAITMMQKAGIDPRPIATLFEQLAAQRPEGKAAEVLSSHPATTERAKRFRQN